MPTEPSGRRTRHKRVACVFHTRDVTSCENLSLALLSLFLSPSRDLHLMSDSKWYEMWKGLRAVIAHGRFQGLLDDMDEQAFLLQAWGRVLGCCRAPGGVRPAQHPPRRDRSRACVHNKHTRRRSRSSRARSSWPNGGPPSRSSVLGRRLGLCLCCAARCQAMVEELNRLQRHGAVFHPLRAATSNPW